MRLRLSRVELKSQHFRLPLQQLSFRLQRHLYVHLQHLKQPQWHNIIHGRQHCGFFAAKEEMPYIQGMYSARGPTQRQICVSTRCHQQQSREKVDEFIVHTLSPRDTQLCRQGYVASSYISRRTRGTIRAVRAGVPCNHGQNIPALAAVALSPMVQAALMEPPPDAMVINKIAGSGGTCSPQGSDSSV